MPHLSPPKVTSNINCLAKTPPPVLNPIYASLKFKTSTTSITNSILQIIDTASKLKEHFKSPNLETKRMFREIS